MILISSVPALEKSWGETNAEFSTHWRRCKCCWAAVEAFRQASIVKTCSGTESQLLLAGGPGKGMYSRLYTKVLNQYHAVDYCAGFHHCYADTGR